MIKLRAKEGKKNRKWGRNKVFCAKYLLEGRKEKNKKLRLLRTLKKQPNNAQLKTVIKKLGL